MKEAGAAAGDYHRMQVWAGQSAAMAKAIPLVIWFKRFGLRHRRICEKRPLTGLLISMDAGQRG